MVGVGDDGLGQLTDVRRSLTDLVGRLDAAVREPDAVTGTDATGVVDVVRFRRTGARGGPETGMAPAGGGGRPDRGGAGGESSGSTS